MSVTKENVLEVLSDVYDPEIPIDIVNLGLVYEVEVEAVSYTHLTLPTNREV